MKFCVILTLGNVLCVPCTLTLWWCSRVQIEVLRCTPPCQHNAMKIKSRRRWIPVTVKRDLCDHDFLYCDIAMAFVCSSSGTSSPQCLNPSCTCVFVFLNSLPPWHHSVSPSSLTSLHHALLPHLQTSSSLVLTSTLPLDQSLLYITHPPLFIFFTFALSQPFTFPSTLSPTLYPFFKLSQSLTHTYHPSPKCQLLTAKWTFSLYLVTSSSIQTSNSWPSNPYPAIHSQLRYMPLLRNPNSIPTTCPLAHDCLGLREWAMPTGIPFLEDPFPCTEAQLRFGISPLRCCTRIHLQVRHFSRPLQPTNTRRCHIPHPLLCTKIQNHHALPLQLKIIPKPHSPPLR